LTEIFIQIFTQYFKLNIYEDRIFEARTNTRICNFSCKEF